jgi:hypothetical protein
MRKNKKLKPYALVKNVVSKTRQDLEEEHSDEQKEVKDMG